MLILLLYLLGVSQQPLLDCACRGKEPCIDIYGNCHQYSIDNAILTNDVYELKCPSTMINCPDVINTNMFSEAIFVPSVSYEANDFSFTKISDNDLSTTYASGTAITPITLYFNMSKKMAIQELDINWIIEPTMYNIYIADTCYLNKNYNVTFSNNFRYATLNTSCNQWRLIDTIHNEITTSFRSRIIDTCINLACDNISHFTFSQMLIEIIDTGGSSVYINDIGGYGIILSEQVSGIERNHFANRFNGDLEFEVVLNYNQELSRIAFGKNDCSEIKYEFNFTEQNKVYINSEKRDSSYEICYSFNILQSNYYKQKESIFFYDIISINPTKLQQNGHINIEINSTYFGTENEYIILSNDQYCNTLFSETYLNNKKGILYDEIGESGSYFLCYSIDYDKWGLTDFKIDIIIPEIYKVSGCTDIQNKTLDCPTVGEILIKVFGKNFDLLYPSPFTSIGPFHTSNTTLVNESLLYVNLPSGTGVNWNVIIEFNINIEKNDLISYKIPEIISVSGCEDNLYETVDCLNYEQNNITIFGNNFGLSGASVLIGSKSCDTVYHINDSAVSCELYGSRGVQKSVFLIQEFGTISSGKDLLSFSECLKGYEIIGNNCVACPIGKFKNDIADSICYECMDGYYSNVTASSLCKKCDENSISSVDKSHCICKSGYYHSKQYCIECDNKDFYGNDMYHCDEEGLTLETLKNADGWWRENKNSINFYECNEESHCPSNLILNDSVQCLQHHTGVLCQLCVDNYNLDWEGYCKECSSESDKIIGISILYFFLVLIGYTSLLIVSFLYGKRVIYMFLKLLSFKGCDTDGADDESEPPSPSDESEESGKKRYQEKIKILISYLQLLTLLSINLNIKWPAFIYDIINGLDFINLDIFGLTNEDIKCSMNIDYYDQFIMTMSMLPLVLFFLYFAKYITAKIKKDEHFIKNKLENRYVYTNVLFTYLLYSPISSSILKLYKCTNINEKWYLTTDMSIECYDDKWILYCLLGVIFSIIYIFGIPFTFYKILTGNRDKLKTSKRFRYRYSFLYEGYKDKYYTFEIFDMTKRIIMMSTVIYLDESATRIMIAMLLIFIYTVYISYIKPIEDYGDNILKIMAGLELFMLLLFGIILEVKMDEKDEYNEAAFQTFTVILIFGVLIVGNIELFKAIYESSNCNRKKKKLTDKVEIELKVIEKPRNNNNVFTSIRCTKL